MSAVDNSHQQAVLALYSDHHGWLLSWLKRKLSHPQNAADLAQDTFVRLLSLPDRGQRLQGDQLRQPRAFLATTATRLLIDQARRRDIERSYLQHLAMMQPDEASSPSPESLLVITETLSTIASLLDSLPAKPRTAFLMYRLDGMGQAEIAAELGVSPSMVKQYIARAMVHCYAALHGTPASS